jgi:hypothetical protein
MNQLPGCGCGGDEEGVGTLTVPPRELNQTCSLSFPSFIFGRGDNEMKIVGTAWYLFGLMIVTAFLESAISYVPEAQHMGNVILGATLALAGVFGLGAAWLTIKRKRNPESQLFRSKQASIVALSIAAIMTLFVLLGGVG